MILDLSNQIREAELLVEMAISDKHGVSILTEKITGDDSGNVTGLDMKKDCPSAARERLQIAADTAKMNEKNLRASEGALKTQIEVAKRDGREDLARELQGRLDKVTEYRKTNLKNMDRIESISSDYALKYKPSDDKYDQRAHAMFLQKQREKMESRLAAEQESEFPNAETIDKLERRIGRVDAAQKESEKWLSANDPKWLKASKEVGIDDKQTAKKATERLGAEIKAKEAAKKAAEKAAASGKTSAVSPAPNVGGATGSASPATATTTAASPTATAVPSDQAAEKTGPKKPGDTWKTSRGAFGAMNKGGIIKYFKSEEEAGTYAGLEKGRRRSRKPKTAEAQIAGKIGGEKPKEPTAIAAGDFAAELLGKRLQMINETYRDSGLGKWFEGESATKEPGWDRYNTAGKRIGKCGDADEGEAYAACLSKQKAKKLGKEGIASFVRRKRAAQRKAGMGKKGQGEAGGGEEPVRVSTGIDKVDEGWSQDYKDSIDCNNPKGFSQRAHCQGKEKNMEEGKEYTIADFQQGIKDLLALIEKHKKLAHEAKASGDMKAYRMHRGHIAEFSADIKTTQEMIKRAERATQMNEASENEPTNPELWSKVQDLVAGRSSSMEHNGETIQGPNDGKGFDVHPSAYSNAWASKLYKRLGGGWRSVKESMQNTVSTIISNSLSKKLMTEEEKPYKGFVKGKNHPEGGLSRAEAKRQGIHAGIETKDEAERKGGFSKLSPETQKRRKSFCARMCGMKAKNTSAETASDPDSKINAALRVWGCRC